MDMRDRHMSYPDDNKLPFTLFITYRSVALNCTSHSLIVCMNITTVVLPFLAILLFSDYIYLLIAILTIDL